MLYFFIFSNSGNVKKDDNSWFFKAHEISSYMVWWGVKNVILSDLFKLSFANLVKYIFVEVYCEKSWKPFWFMWSGSTTDLLKVRNIERVKPFYSCCEAGTIRLGIIVLLNRMRYKYDDKMLSKHKYSNLRIQ